MPARQRLIGTSVFRVTSWILVGAIVTVWASGSIADAQMPCPPQTPERRKCPWTPEGYTVNPCGPGFCWDGGPQGALACKQENSIPNAHRTDLNDLICNDGYVGDRDRCTNVLVRCRKPGGDGWLSWLLPAGGTQRVRDGWDSMTARDAGVLERTAGGLSLLGAGAEMVLMMTGIWALGRWAAGRLAGRAVAASAARRMAIFEGEEFVKDVGRMAADPLSQAGARQLESMVQQRAGRIVGQLVRMVGEDAAKKMTREQIAGAVFNVLEHNGPLSPVIREQVFNAVRDFITGGVRYLGADGLWHWL